MLFNVVCRKKDVGKNDKQGENWLNETAASPICTCVSSVRCGVLSVMRSIVNTLMVSPVCENQEFTHS